MREHECTQTSMLKAIHKAIYGNGQLGLIKDVEKMKETVEHMNIHFESFTTSLAALAKSQLEDDLIKRMKEDNSKRWGNIIVRSTAIIGAAGVIMAAIIKFGG